MSQDIPSFDAAAANKAASLVAAPVKPGAAVNTAKPNLEPAKPPALSPLFLVPSEQKRLHYCAEIPPNVSIDRMMEPDFWAHVSHKLQEGTRIEALRADHAWAADLLVRKINLSNHEVYCYLLQKFDLEAGAATKTSLPVRDQFLVAFGGAAKWRVIRKGDNEVVHSGEASRADADAWLDAHIAAARI